MYIASDWQIMLVSESGCTWIDAMPEVSEQHHPEFRRRDAEAVCADGVSLSADSVSLGALPHPPVLSMPSGLSSAMLPEP